MTITTQQTVLQVAPTDAEGYPVGSEVSVWIEYLIEVDASYGEGADGNQGTTLVEYTILDAYVQPEDLKKLTAAQAEQVLSEARCIFTHSKKHF